ncbi:MAG: hypothetical protein AAF607_12105 [Pseudomonadota bacterium]
MQYSQPHADLLKHLGEYEMHFNKIQVEYRKLAFSVFAANFAVVGFIISGEKIFKVDLNILLIIAAIISVICALGIRVISRIDSGYQRLLVACSDTALGIEQNPTEFNFKLRDKFETLLATKEFLDSPKGAGERVRIRQLANSYYEYLSGCCLVFSVFSVFTLLGFLEPLLGWLRSVNG